MKRSTLSSLAAAAAVGAMLPACAVLDAGGRRLNRSPELPAADGVVRFSDLSGDDTEIELHVKNLELPERLSPPGWAYVAWVQSTREDAPRNVGALDLGADLEGDLRTRTSGRRFDLFVTAETTGDAAQPTGERLLWASRE